MSVFKWGLSKTDLLQLGWSSQHDELAACVMREQKLRLPRDRRLLLEIVLVHMAIKRGEMAPRGGEEGNTMKRRRRTAEDRRKLEEEVEAIKRDMRRSLLEAWRDGRMERVFEEWAKEEEAERDKPSAKH